MTSKWRVMCSELQLHKNEIKADPPLFYNEGSGGREVMTTLGK